jgi:hypothetical protein
LTALFVEQLFKLLQDNLAEVAEPYIFEKTRPITGTTETIVFDEGINMANLLSSHVKAYMATVLKAEVGDEIVAVEEAPENSYSASDEDKPNSKQKKQVELLRHMKNGDLGEQLIDMQTDALNRRTKTHMQGRKMKWKERKEWARDAIRHNDEGAMAYLSYQI